MDYGFLNLRIPNRPVVEIKKSREKLVLELPKTAEVIDTGRGVIVVLLPQTADEDKRALLEKLYRIPYRDRELSKLKKNINQNELRALRELMKEGKVFIKAAGKNRYVALKEDVYNELRKNLGRGTETAGTGDYAILSEDEAKQFMEKNHRFYTAVKHFDGKVYIVRNSFLKANSKRILEALKSGPMHVDEISQKTELPQEGALCILRILNEAAEVLEVKKNVFSLPE